MTRVLRREKKKWVSGIPLYLVMKSDFRVLLLPVSSVPVSFQSQGDDEEVTSSDIMHALKMSLWMKSLNSSLPRTRRGLSRKNNFSTLDFLSSRRESSWSIFSSELSCFASFLPSMLSFKANTNERSWREKKLTSGESVLEAMLSRNSHQTSEQQTSWEECSFCTLLFLQLLSTLRLQIPISWERDSLNDVTREDAATTDKTVRNYFSEKWNKSNRLTEIMYWLNGRLCRPLLVITFRSLEEVSFDCILASQAPQRKALCFSGVLRLLWSILISLCDTYPGYERMSLALQYLKVTDSLIVLSTIKAIKGKGDRTCLHIPFVSKSHSWVRILSDWNRSFCSNIRNSHRE